MKDHCQGIAYVIFVEHSTVGLTYKESLFQEMLNSQPSANKYVYLLFINLTQIPI